MDKCFATESWCATRVHDGIQIPIFFVPGFTDQNQIITSVNGVGCADVIAFKCTFDNLSGDWSNVTPKLGIQWAYNDDSQVYAYYSKGFHSGGFNFRNADPAVIPPGPTREEEVNTFEVGLKTEFADGRMRLNLAAFHNEITDAQREINVGDPSPAGVVVLQATINAGDVTIDGIEADFVGLLTDNFSVTASYGWMDGDYDSIDPVVAQIEAGLGLPFPLIGGRPPRLAPTNYSVGFSWDIPAGGLGLFNVSSNYSFREAHFYDDSNLNEFEDQKCVNASINWFAPNESWQVSAYGKNLNDHPNYGNLTSIAGLYIAGPMQKGRIYGIEVNFRMQQERREARRSRAKPLLRAVSRENHGTGFLGPSSFDRGIKFANLRHVGVAVVAEFNRRPNADTLVGVIQKPKHHGHAGAFGNTVEARLPVWSAAASTLGSEAKVKGIVLLKSIDRLSGGGARHIPIEGNAAQQAQHRAERKYEQGFFGEEVYFHVD